MKQEEDIEILFAIESGSRAWGFPSPDSDYDVRIVYKRKLSNYLTIYPERDVIETPIVDNFDVGGWDIKKFLQHMQKSNAVTWEWMQSPVIYEEDTVLKEELFKLSKEYFSPTSCFHHYFSMANKVKGELEGYSEIKLKKLFYILRPLLSARWIVEFQTIPPMELEGLMNADYIDDSSKAEIKSLVQKKASLDEAQTINRVQVLDDFINKLLVDCEEGREKLKHVKVSDKKINAFFQGLF